MRILSICNIDGMAYKLLLPWLNGLASLGEVHVACCPGQYTPRLKEAGIVVYDIPMRRSWSPLAHLRAIFTTVRLLKRVDFDVVTVHSAVGATVGRIACMITGQQRVIHVVHGMMTTEHTGIKIRVVFYLIEKALSFVTDSFHFVSNEDLVFARRSRLIRPWQHAAWGCGGVPVDYLCPDEALRARVRGDLGLSDDIALVGIVARMVREKGFVEFFEMAKALAMSGAPVRFIVVGDTLVSDRDGIGQQFRRWVEEYKLQQHFIFTGLTDAVRDYLAAMDIFVLPTYREGFPRSVLEAMAMALPVVATEVRGCREAVLPGKTGLLVPLRDSEALTSAVRQLVNDPAGRRRMGEAGRTRVVENFEVNMMTERFLDTVRAVIERFGSGRRGRAKGSARLSPEAAGRPEVSA